jgi:hypothetical protein
MKKLIIFLMLSLAFIAFVYAQNDLRTISINYAAKQIGPGSAVGKIDERIVSTSQSFNLAENGRVSKITARFGWSNNPISLNATIVADDGGKPSTNNVGGSSAVVVGKGDSYDFVFSENPEIKKGTYWVVFRPTFVNTIRNRDYAHHYYGEGPDYQEQNYHSAIQYGLDGNWNHYVYNDLAMEIQYTATPLNPFKELDSGIAKSKASEAEVIQNISVYIVKNGQVHSAKVDRFVMIGDKRFIINYLDEDEDFASLPDLPPVVYYIELEEDIASAVTLFIDNKLE